MNDKKKHSTLKVERPAKDKPSVLAVANETKKTKVAGRQPLPPEEKKSVPINFKITPQQHKNLTEKAGDVALGKFIRLELEKAGVI